MGENTPARHKSKFWNQPIVIGITGAIGGALLTSVIVTIVTVVTSKGELVLTHSDIDVKASTIKKLVDEHEKAIKIFEETVQAVTKELDAARRQLLEQRATGKATRNMEGQRIGRNLIYINPYSDARRFGINETVNISSQGKTVRAVVAGTIDNAADPTNVCKLNVDTAEELGVTKSDGIALVTIGHVLSEKPDEK